jgi:hypothetical protein
MQAERDERLSVPIADDAAGWAIAGNISSNGRTG